MMVVSIGNISVEERCDSMVYEQFDITGRKAIVTGASQGIGKTIAETLTAAGVDVAICSRSPEKIAAVADSINEASVEGSAVAVECDVTDRDAVAELVDEATAAFGHLDILINNAGGSFEADLEDLSENSWKTIVDINLHGAFHCTQEARKSMRESGGGNIINISSMGGIRGAPRMAHYGAAKAGLINFTQTAAYEWADDDIRINCIAPGFIATPGVESQMGLTAENIERSNVKRRAGKTSEIADVVLFLASRASSFINGETLPVRGIPAVEMPPRLNDL